MAKLNEKNERTEKTIHLMITDKCYRKCPLCCNNQYDINDVAFVTDEELKNAEHIFLTGGEPFAFADPCEFAKQLKEKYPNIKNIYVYTNALELYLYLLKNDIYSIDGVTISIKNKFDYKAFEKSLQYNEQILKLKSNWLYTFPNFNDINYPEKFFTKRNREWQEDFVPDPNSIFRRWR